VGSCRNRCGALVVIGLSYLLYSRQLSAEELDVYSAAVAVGNLATLVLDGGVNIAIIKHATAPARSEERALLHIMLAFSLGAARCVRRLPCQVHNSEVDYAPWGDRAHSVL